jgi:isopropylmalate/homocitrate/citramalate synthase
MGKNPWYEPKKWFTSPMNFSDDAMAMYDFADTIQFHDVTLRDGEQQISAAFNPEQKIALAEKMAEIGIQRIEPGMPAVSKQDRIAIEAIAKRGLSSKIFSFCRCRVPEIQMAYDLGTTGVVLEIPGSESMIRDVYKWPEQKAIDKAVEATKFAHEKGLYIVFFLVSFTRGNVPFATGFIRKVKDQGGHFDSIACVDSTGGLNPIGAYTLVKQMRANFPGVPIEYHGHDDFGVGAADTLMALAAGAEVAHTAIGGMGERAGNAGFEDVALSLLATFNKDTGIKYEKMYPLARLVSELTGNKYAINRAIIGEKVSAIESGMVVGWYDGIKDIDPTLILPYAPELVGQPPVEYIIGKMSAATTLDHYLQKMGVACDDKDLREEILEKIKDYAIMKGQALHYDEFVEIVNAVVK